jgi:hypothetical protein
MGNFGFQELIMLMLLIAVLQMTGLWKVIIGGLRDLRGEPSEGAGAGAGPATSKDVESYFLLLGLSPSATWEEIDRAYREKAKIHHPDHGGDEDTMRALNHAYATLKRLRARR